MALAGPLADSVDQLNFQLLQNTFDVAKVNRILNGYGRDINGNDRQAAAVLISLGAIAPEDLANQPKLESKLKRFHEIVESNNPALVGRIGDASLITRLSKAWDHNALLAEETFLDALGERLAEGIITGYDVRRKGVYDGFPASHTFIYSQSSLLHMQQLVTLMNSEDIDGWLYVTPKVSAFLYRDDWGPLPENVKTLSNGIRVVQGREVAVLFEFDSPDDRYRFDKMITRYAKKDKEDEAGLIANAWWQPFYYTDSVMKGFKPISLVIVTAGDVEATLTVLEEKTNEVVNAMASEAWKIRVDRVWVNPPFYRFLNGGYK